MKITVKRTTFTSTSTIGELYIDGVFECFTLEDVVREVEGQPVEKWKITKKTAIPKGEYNVIVNRSIAFKRELPLLENVKGYVGVRIHSGNVAEHTEGCILVGKKTGKDFVGSSREAFSSLFNKIKKALLNKEKVTLSIG